MRPLKGLSLPIEAREIGRPVRANLLRQVGLDKGRHSEDSIFQIVVERLTAFWSLICRRQQLIGRDPIFESPASIASELVRHDTER